METLPSLGMTNHPNTADDLITRFQIHGIAGRIMKDSTGEWMRSEDVLSQLATLTQERDALREVLGELYTAINTTLWMPGYTWPICRGRYCDCISCRIHKLLSPPAGAGNGKEVGK